MDREHEAIATLVMNVFDIGNDSFLTTSGCMKLSVLPLSIKAVNEWPAILTVQVAFANDG